MSDTASKLGLSGWIAQSSQNNPITRITAPYGGIVTARHIKVGETAQVGQPLLSGFDLSALRIQAHVPQTLVGAIQKAGYIWAQNTAQVWHKISDLTIFPQADPHTHTVAVRGLLNPTQFQPLPGSYLRIAIPTGTQQVIQIPPSSLLERGDLQAVYVQQDTSTVLRQVVTGKRSPTGIVILSGLQAGERILTDALAYQP